MPGKARLWAAAACLLFGGCATQTRPGEPRRTGDGLEESGLGGRVAVVPSAKQRLRILALQEWTLWGRVKWDAATDAVEWPAGAVVHQEDAPDSAARVLHYWYAYKKAGFRAQDALYADGSLVP